MPPRKTAIKRKPLRSAHAPFNPAAGKGPRRKSLRRVSLTNSKGHEDLQLRLQLRQQYRNEHPIDEIAWLFPRMGRYEVLVPTGEHGATTPVNRNASAADVHHVSGFLNGSPRWDVATNLVALCRSVHAFCERWTSDGLVLCLYQKLCDGSLDLPKLDEITGLSVLGKIANSTCRFPFAASCRERLLEGIANSEAAT